MRPHNPVNPRCFALHGGVARQPKKKKYLHFVLYPLDVSPQRVHNVLMKITNTTRVDGWKSKHANARKPLTRWVEMVKNAQWNQADDVAQSFGRNVDRISHKNVVSWVFNIKGNSYRLVSTIDFELGRVVPRFFMTHAEYDKNRWKDQL